MTVNPLQGLMSPLLGLGQGGDPVQGRFGVDTRMVNPQWAEWLDRVQGEGVDQFRQSKGQAQAHGNPLSGLHEAMFQKR